MHGRFWRFSAPCRVLNGDVQSHNGAFKAQARGGGRAMPAICLAVPRFPPQPFHKTFHIRPRGMPCQIDHEVALHFQAELVFERGVQFAAGDP